MRKSLPIAAAVLFLFAGSLWAQSPPSQPTVQFDNSTYSVQRSSGSATITVILSADPGANTVTVDYSTSDGTAIAGTDYTATSGTLTFTSGVTSQTFSVPLLMNVAAQSNETVNLSLSNVSNATYDANKTAVVTIEDSPPVLTLTPANTAICSGGLATAPHQTTITVSLTDGVNPYIGQTVVLSTDFGSLSSASAVTDANGNATVTLTSDGKCSDGGSLYQATVTASVANGVFTTTCQVEFQPTSGTLTATYSSLVTGETTPLQLVALSWNGQAIASHSLTWPNPASGYGDIQSGASTQSDTSGNGSAVYESGANGGTVQLSVADTSVSFFDSGDNPNFVLQEVVQQPTLKLQRQTGGAGGYSDIVGGVNSDLLPGEIVDLQVVLTPAPMNAPTEGGFGNSDTAFGLYSADVDSAGVQGVEFTSPTNIILYWVDAGDAKFVSAYVMIGNVKVTGSATLNVKPLTATLAANAGPVKILIGKTFSQVYISAPDGQIPGVLFTGSVKTPDGMNKGQWQFIQLANSARYTTWSNGLSQYADTNGSFMLDAGPSQHFPYPLYPRAANQIVPADGTQQTAADEPSQQIQATSTDGSPTTTNASIKNNQYQMYIMFQSLEANAQWVPVMELDWNWSASVSVTTPGNYAFDVDPQVNVPKNGQASTNFPQWKRNNGNPKVKWLNSP